MSAQGAEVGWGAVGQGRDPLLTGVNLKVMKGERVLVLGPNGAGKSTLLKAIAGAISPHAGPWTLHTSSTCSGNVTVELRRIRICGRMVLAVRCYGFNAL